MEIAVRTRNIPWNERLQRQVERSVEFAVDRHLLRINRISVWLADVNGPRGGVDKLCQMTAELQGAGPVLIVETDNDLATAINRAARRLGYRIGRKLQRRRMSRAREYRASIRAA